jgi:hypothetical protein
VNDVVILILKSLAPKRNIICAYVAGGAVLVIGHFSSYFLKLDLTTQQTATISVGATVVAGHIWDIVAGVIAKKIEIKENVDSALKVK